MLVKLRVSEAAFNEIMGLIVAAEQLDRIRVARGEPGGLGLDMSEIALVVDPNKMGER